MRLAGLLRLTAIGIAVLAMLDPPVHIAVLTPLDVTVAVARSPLDEVPAANDGTRTRQAAADLAAEAIVSGLGPDAEVRVRAFDDPLRLPCDALSPCVVVTDGTLPITPPRDRVGHTSIVRIGDGLSPNVGVLTARGAAGHRAAEGTMRVTLEGHGVSGRTTRVEVRDGAAVAGEAAHAWTSDGVQEISVPWWPQAAGARRLTVAAVTEDVEERTLVDNAVSVVVDVGEERWPVLVYERRPSWATTFVRRALEQDPRFEVEVHTALAPSVSAGTGVARLNDLDRTRVIVAGGIDTLTDAEVSRLESYLRNRGGSVVLVPDRAPAGPVLRLFSRQWREQLTATPARIGPFVGSEWLVSDGLDELSEAAVTAERGPIVVSSPSGRGRLVTSGALDAWRHRGDGDSFDRFWRSLIADLVLATGDAVSVTVSPRAVRPGGRVTVSVAARAIEPRTSWSAAATLLCAGRPEVAVRLWPGHPSGAFEGTARPDPAASECVVRAGVDGLGEGQAPVLVTPDRIETGQIGGPSLGATAERTGGLDVNGQDVARVVQALRGLAPGTRTPESRYPMRSAWWLVPFIACVTGEWWLRRRAGLR